MRGNSIYARRVNARVGVQSMSLGKFKASLVRAFTSDFCCELVLWCLQNLYIGS